MKIAVDFDGTCVDHKFPEVGEDAPFVVDVLQELVDAGHKLILNTMRSGQYLEEAVQWFVEREIPLSGINADPAQSSWTQSPKVFADLYIDDAALGSPCKMFPGFSRKCVSWTAVREELLDLKTASELAEDIEDHENQRIGDMR